MRGVGEIPGTVWMKLRRGLEYWRITTPRCLEKNEIYSRYAFEYY